MSIDFSQPMYFLLLLVLLPIVTFMSIRAKKVIRLFENYRRNDGHTSSFLKYKIYIRIIAWCISWVCICIALAGPSWGTELVPVQKTGRAVSFVFDISHSMEAMDMNSNSMTRLEASKQFTQELLSVLPGVASSAVLAKGDGVLAVPLTEDFYSISNLVVSLSSKMLSHPGSSLEKGILKAIESFPPQSARRSYIIVLTDGDDTLGDLNSAVDTAINFGVDVIFVGFGSPIESDVLAGDGLTTVKTALRLEKLQAIAEKDNVFFINGNDTTGIGEIEEIIRPSIFFSDDATTTSYESASINRHRLFVRLALFSFIFGFFVYTFVPGSFFRFFKGSSKSALLLVVCLSSFIFTGCTAWFGDAKTVLEGSYQWAQQNYQQSIASFLEVHTRSLETENLEVRQYGLFGLSANYIMQGETKASLTKINEMDPIVSPSLDFARWYNKGVIFHRNGEYEIAAFCFKKALLIDNSNIQAKINLELCVNEGTTHSQTGIQERIPVAEQKEASGAADAVFSLIRKSEEGQWKSQEVVPEESDIIDY